jgi:transcriptional regulator with XRE-family HTH domain
MRSIHTKRQEKLRRLLREARKAAGLTQVQLAERLGVYKSYVSNYETGERRLDVVEFIAVAEAIAIDPESIINGVRTG